jgi:hypothetical protein
MAGWISPESEVKEYACCAGPKKLPCRKVSHLPSPVNGAGGKAGLSRARIQDHVTERTRASANAHHPVPPDGAIHVSLVPDGTIHVSLALLADMDRESCDGLLICPQITQISEDSVKEKEIRKNSKKCW